MTNSIDSGYTDSNESFDLFHQNLTIIGPDNTVIIINMDDIHDYMRYAVEVCTNRGSQIGVSVIVLAVLLLVTKAEKRRLPVFILNTLSLLINIPRTILQVVYFTSAWYDSFAYFTGDLSRVPHSAYASTCAADILTLLLVICIEMSLLVQVWTVSTGAAESYRFLVMALSISAALAAVALRFAITIINIRTTLYPFEPTSYLIPTIAPAAQIAAACSIVLFASIFCAKLGYALLRRRRLGLTQFGPMQVIFIMSCQTMAIPGRSRAKQTFSGHLPVVDANFVIL